MLVKVDKLIGPALDWAVAKCINPLYGMVGVSIHQDNRDRWHVTLHGERGCFAPSTNWAQGGPIIDREGLPTYQIQSCDGKLWKCCNSLGPTLLIAAMRCYVSSQLGNEIEIPNELFKGNKC